MYVSLAYENLLCIFQVSLKAVGAVALYGVGDAKRKITQGQCVVNGSYN